MDGIRRILTVNPTALLWPGAVFLITLGIGWVVRRLILRALKAWTSRTQGHAGVILTESLRGPIVIWMLILATHLGFQASALPDRFTEWESKVLLVLWI